MVPFPFTALIWTSPKTMTDAGEGFWSSGKLKPILLFPSLSMLIQSGREIEAKRGGGEVKGERVKC